jgi:hypothetical protein
MTARARAFDPETPSGGAACAAVAERFAEADARRRVELDRAIRSDVTTPIPLNLAPERTPMPAKKTPHACCGSLSRHKKDCPDHGVKAPPGKWPAKKVAAFNASPVGSFDARSLTDEQLTACVMEARRRVEGRAALAKILGE